MKNVFFNNADFMKIGKEITWKICSNVLKKCGFIWTIKGNSALVTRLCQMTVETVSFVAGECRREPPTKKKKLKMLLLVTRFQLMSYVQLYDIFFYT